MFGVFDTPETIFTLNQITPQGIMSADGKTVIAPITG
jgi:hypothetical protein